jgi:acyl-coenzyme A thioesterase PaaI-like protein
VTAHFTCDPDPENPGWLRWRLNDPTRYNEAVLGPLLVRRESAESARVRLTPRHHHTNLSDNVHGAVTLGLIDVALFAAWRQISDGDAGGAVTLGLDTQFIGAGDPGRPLDAVVELLRETRRLAFLRGLVVQDDDVVASFSGTIRKPSRL